MPQHFTLSLWKVTGARPTTPVERIEFLIDGRYDWERLPEAGKLSSSGFRKLNTYLGKGHNVIDEIEGSNSLCEKIDINAAAARVWEGVPDEQAHDLVSPGTIGVQLTRVG